jgi:hypothetical protein
VQEVLIFIRQKSRPCEVDKFFARSKKQPEKSRDRHNSRVMAAIVYSTSPNRVSSSASQNQYSSYGSINKSMLSQSQHHHTVHPGSTSGGPPPLSIYQVKEHHNNYLMSHSRNYNYKRKSAVEMLAESKPYYVKSETVLDRHQQLNARNGGGSNTLSCE